MRATERLLAVISEGTARAAIAVHETEGAKAMLPSVNDDLAAVAEAVIELRRRGDTLARSRDVQAVATAAFRWLDEYRGLEVGADDDLAHAIERLENAIGGR
jgi:hypothetical protein